MTKRWIISAFAVVAVVGATAGIAYAAGTRSADTNTPGTAGLMTACEAMHDTPAMQAMHEHMPAALQDACEAMQEQMDHMMGGSGMGSGMMSSGVNDAARMVGDSGNGDGSMPDHHASGEG